MKLTDIKPAGTITEEDIRLHTAPLVEMSNIYPKRTGIAGIVITITPQYGFSGGQHPSRVKVSLGARYDDNSTTIKLEDKEQIGQPLPRDVYKYVCQWIDVNRNELERYYTGEQQDTEAFLNALKPL